MGRDKDPVKVVTSDAQTLFALIREHASTSNEALNMSRAADIAGITSKRRLLELIDELERAGVIRTRKLSDRGRPRVIELDASSRDLPRKGGQNETESEDETASRKNPR